MRDAETRRGLVGALACTLAWTMVAATPVTAQTLDIYWIDVEGGGASLVVAPTGESMLVDTGWPQPEGRDAARIVAAMREAGLEKLDYMLITPSTPTTSAAWPSWPKWSRTSAFSITAARRRSGTSSGATST